MHCWSQGRQVCTFSSCPPHHQVFIRPHQVLSLRPPNQDKVPRRIDGPTAARGSVAIGVYLTADQPCFDLDDVVKNLRTGTYRYNKPEAAYVDEPFRVVLVLPTAPGQNVSRPFIGAPGKIEERDGPHRAVPPSDAARRYRLQGDPSRPSAANRDDEFPRRLGVDGRSAAAWKEVSCHRRLGELAGGPAEGARPAPDALRGDSDQRRHSFAGSRAPSTASRESPSASPR